MTVVAGLQVDKTINYGHLLQALTIAIGLAGSVLYGVNQNTETRLLLSANIEQVNKLVPSVAALEAANALSTERLTNHANSLRSMREDTNASLNELRRFDGQLQTEVNQNKVDIAQIKGHAVR